jgi:hypothetical protein
MGGAILLGTVVWFNLTEGATPENPSSEYPLDERSGLEGP